MSKDAPLAASDERAREAPEPTLSPPSAGSSDEDLDRLPVRVIGAVLNDVREGAATQYYKYHSYYMPGYDAEDEEGGGEAQKALVGEKE